MQYSNQKVFHTVTTGECYQAYFLGRPGVLHLKTNFKRLDPIFLLKSGETSWAWWFTPVIPGLGRLKQEDHKFKVSLDYKVRPCLKKEK
jgi:hypothetical protein